METRRPARDPPAGETRPLIREPGTWWMVTACWAAVGLVSAAVEALMAPTAGHVAARLVYALLWWWVTLVAVALTDLVTVRDSRQYGRLLIHAAGGAAAAVAWAAAAYSVNDLLIPGWDREGAPDLVRDTFHTSFLFYAGVAAIAHGVVRARELKADELRAARAAGLAVQAQLHALKMELQPHFLFNTLNSISALMHRDVAAANEMLVLLADVLEASIATAREQEVELAAEIATLRTYVRIHQIRLGDRLEVSWNVDPDALAARVPHLVLQPIVENAIVHGIAGRARGGRLEISARRAGGRLELAVRDDGPGVHRPEPGFGLGIANTRARLQQLYGQAHRFALADAPGGGTVARVSIPFATATRPA